MRAVLVSTVWAAWAAMSEAARVAAKTELQAYEEFRRSYGEVRTGDPVSFSERAASFAQRLHRVRQQNTQQGALWVAELNRFADYTEQEFQALLGHKPIVKAGASSKATSFLELQPNHNTLLESVDWRATTNATSRVKDQGSCGSCWAVAAAGALEVHAEKSSRKSVPPLSFEQLVDCVPNERRCGGTGGCKGATSELAFEWIKAHGLAAQDAYTGYLTNGGAGQCTMSAKASVLAQGFTRLPENQLYPLMAALSEKGPVVVSVDATPWDIYKKGIFNGCKQDAVVNHAVLAVGYGASAGASPTGYWLVRNSWGSGWGEDGFIRVMRHGAEGQYCGVDHKPEEGVGCAGGPAQIKVCGMCGILSDTSYPDGVRSVT